MDIEKIYSILETVVKKYNNPMVESIRDEYNNDIFKILVATLLSARTKDELTYKVLKEKFFTKIKQLEDLKTISITELENLIYPIGFYKNKAKFLKKLPIVLEKEFNNIIPNTIEELIKLPGVGRKTANLVVSIGFNKPAICVDTHVHRITNRIGIVNTKNPLETEMKLREKLPIKLWNKTNFIFVLYGKNLCYPINPKCSECKIKEYCQYYKNRS